MSKDNELVVLTKKELEDLIYNASYAAANKATSSLFNGLAKRFLYSHDEILGQILYEVEELNRK